jgi:hypothetical protein
MRAVESRIRVVATGFLESAERKGAFSGDGLHFVEEVRDGLVCRRRDADPAALRDQ